MPAQLHLHLARQGGAGSLSSTAARPSSSPAASTSSGQSQPPSASEAVLIPRSDVRPTDVLFGRGAGVSEHTGNVRFRHLIAARKLRYRDAPTHNKNKVKNDVAREVVDLVHGRDVDVERGWDPPGRFLRSAAEEARAGKKVKDKATKTKSDTDDNDDSNNHLWVEVTDRRAQEKCKQALRQQKWDAVSERAAAKSAAGAGSGSAIGGGGGATGKSSNVSGSASLKLENVPSLKLDNVDDIGMDLTNIPEPIPVFASSLNNMPTELGADDGADRNDSLDLADLRFLMPVIGEGESIHEQPALNAPLAQNTTSLSLREKVALAKRITQRLREQHEQGSTVGYQSLLGMARQLGVWISSQVPRHPSSDSISTDLAYLGVILHEHFSGKVILSQSSSSFTYDDSISVTDGDEDNDSAHMSQRSSKRERLKRDSTLSVTSAEEESTDRPNWIDATPLHEYGLPVSLSILVSSLLSASDNTVETRYQSVDECEIDLTMMVSSPDRFLYDAPPDTPTGILQISSALYGRDGHETALKSAISRICNPACPAREVVLISGNSGTGKTALAEKIGSSVEDRGGYFIRGAFDQIAGVAVVCGAFDSYCQELVRRNDNHLLSVRTRLVQALGPDCNALAQLIPSVALISGLTQTGSVARGIITNGGDLLAQLIFYVRTFVRIISHPDHPLIIHLDDMHRIDSASLQLLEMLITDSEIRSFLILCCYRSDDVMDDHPLKTHMTSIREAGVSVSTLLLQNIDRSSVNELLSDTLRLSPRITRSLANVIHSKTSGNPLFVTQFIRSLVDEKLLSWSANYRRWVWNTSTIQAKNIDNTVVGLMTAKILRLSPDVQQGKCSAFGFVAPPETTIYVCIKKEHHTSNWLPFLSIFCLYKQAY